MALYGDLDEVKRLLRSHESIIASADVIADIEAIQRTVTLAIDQKTGRTFGVSPVSTSRIVWAGSQTYLLLDPPARSITSIEYGGTWNGLDLVSPELLDATWYAFDPVDADGLIWGVRLGIGTTWGLSDVWGQARTPIRVTAEWADTSSSLAIPDDIMWLATYVIAALYRRQRTSASAQIGIDGSVTAIPDPWKDETVKTIIEKYSLIKTVRLAG